MNDGESKLESQVALWTLLGPCIMIITLIILLISPLRTPLYMPLLGLLAIPLCWQWKLKGMALALAALAAAFLLQQWNFMPGRVFADVLLATSSALTLLIMTLCFLEVEELCVKEQHASSSHLQEFMGISAKIEQLEEQKEKELALATAKAKQLELQLNEGNAQLIACQSSCEAAKEKMSNVLAQNESLLRELFQKRNECDKLNQQIQAQTEDYDLLTSENQLLTEQIAALEAKTAELKKQIDTFAQAEVQDNAAHHTETASTSSTPKPKSKSGKASKTNTWADAILSRWSEPQDPSQ
jgi:hypothetical protein